MLLANQGRHMSRVTWLLVRAMTLWTLVIVSAGAGPATAPVAATPVPDLFSLAGAAGLPAYLKASPTTYADDTGILGTGELTTVASDFVNHDFTFDVVYSSEPGEQSIFHIGIGGADGFIHSRVHGPGHGGNATFAVFRQPEASLGKTGEDPGPHLMRLEKRGDAFTMSLCTAFDGKTFKPTYSKTVPLKAAVPGLARHNSPLYIGKGNGGKVLAVRLVVDGKPAPTGARNKFAALAAPWPPADAPMIGLAGTSGLPSYLHAAGGALASETGLSASHVHTDESILGERDFTFDFVFRFKQENERSVFVAGFGPAQRQDNGLQDSIGSRIHGPGHGGNCTLNVAGQPEGTIGKLSSSAGPHLFRIERRGNTLTMAISPDFDGKFDPVAAKTIPDLKGASGFLKGRKPVVFVTGAPILESVRLWVDGKRLDSATPAVANKGEAQPTAAAAPDAPLRLIGLKKSLPVFFQPQRDLKFEGGGLALDGNVVRTRAADFLNKDFTFDLVYRVPTDGPDDNLFIGIGDDKVERGRFDGAAGVHLYGARHEGLVRIRMGRISETDFVRPGGAGPHLVRLRKVGNTLTVLVSPRFDGKFEPGPSTTVPDLKGAGPFLSEKNAPLFIHGKGIVEQVRLVMEGEAPELQDLELAVPPVAVAGKPLRQPLVKPADVPRVQGKRFAIESGPAGLTITPAGELSWVPTAEQVGRHEVTVRIEGAKLPTLASATIEIVSAADAAAVKGDLTKVAALRRLPLTGTAYELVTGHDGASMLLLDGEQLRRLAADGITVQDTLKLPKVYDRIRERPDYFVALAGGNDKCLDILDKKTLNVRRSVPMDYRHRFDLALSPLRRECYVSVEKPTKDGLRSDILIVEEDSGDVREPPDFFGRWIRVSADGKALFAGYREVFEKGSRLLINPDRIHVIPEFGNIDLLIVYDLTRPEPRIVRVKDEVGSNGYGIELSPDERRIAYLSGAGYPLYSYNVSAWDPRDFTKRAVTYPTKENGAGPGKIAFHPMLPIAAAPSASGAVAFDRETGKLQPDRLNLRAASLPSSAKPDAVHFSADGRNLIVHCVDEAAKERFLLKVKLKLSQKEEAQLSKPAAPAPGRPPRGSNRGNV